MDTVSVEKRSAIMKAVRREDTSPEVRVRKATHALGFRFRLHRKDLPGSPDLVFPRHKLCIFVHGCFWHRHFGCKRASTPKSNLDYWRRKFEENRCRDLRKAEELRVLGWRVEVIWECQTLDPDLLRSIILDCIDR